MNTSKLGVELYFAYGSCMGNDICRTVSTFRRLGRAHLQGWEIGFTRYSVSWGGGVADIVESLGGEVEGVLYELDAEGLHRLDQREGVSFGIYQRIAVPIETPDGNSITVWTYEVVDKSDVEYAPSYEYGTILLRGAKEYTSHENFEILSEKIKSLQYENCLEREWI